MNIGQQIRSCRKKAGLSQKELGERLGVSQQHIAQYENEKRIPKIETIQRIAAALDTDLFDIISVNEYRNLMNTEVKETIQNDIKSGKIHLITEDEQELTTNYLKLNDTGKAEARKRVSELTEIPRYTQKEKNLSDKKD